MVATFGDFMFGLAVMTGQAAVFGMLALWLASRRNRLGRIIGGLCMVSAAWMSVVPIIDRFTGYPVRSDIDSNLLTIFALVVGWTAGRNQRLSASSAQPGNSTPPRLALDGFVQSIGSWIVGLSQLYGIVAGLFGLFVTLAIVFDAAGFWGLVIGFTVLPATFTIAPLYAGFKWHNWMPAAFCYGGPLAAFLGYVFGKLVAGEPLRE